MEKTKFDPPESHHVHTHVNMAPRHGLINHFKVDVQSGITLGNQPSHALMMRRPRGSDVGRSPAQMVKHDTNLAQHMLK